MSVRELPICSSACLDFDEAAFFVVTAAFSDRMAIFDDEWRLAGWTKHVRAATIFTLQQDALSAIDQASGLGVVAALRSGKLTRELDEDLGEYVYADQSGAVLLKPRLGIMERGPSWSIADIRHFTRGEFREAQGKGRRPSNMGPRDVSGREYKMPMGQGAVAQRARAFGSYSRSA